MHQQARADNLTICYRKKQIDVRFYASVLLLTMNFGITLYGLRMHSAVAW